MKIVNFLIVVIVALLAQNHLAFAQGLNLQPGGSFGSLESMYRRIYFSTNFADLTKGSGNVALDFLVNSKLAMGFRAATSSQKEEIKRNGNTEKLTVDRTSYSLGATIFFAGVESPQTLVFSPGLAFGQKRDALDVENQSGLSLKLTGLVRMKNDLCLEAGLRGDTLEGGTLKGDLYAGFGYLF